MEILLKKLLEGDKSEPEKKEPKKSGSLPRPTGGPEARIHPVLLARLFERIARLEPAVREDLRKVLRASQR
jgi:hypothetical protein